MCTMQKADHSKLMFMLRLISRPQFNESTDPQVRRAAILLERQRAVLGICQELWHA